MGSHEEIKAVVVSTLQALDSGDVDLERMPMDEVFEQLRCTKEGLTTEEGGHRLHIFGYNKLEEKRESKFLKFLGFMWNPLSWVMEAAAIMAIALANGPYKGEVAPPDWEDFVGIVVLLLINSTISFIEENNAGNAAAVLMARLAPKAKVLRDGRWSEQDASILVPGDIIGIKLGDIVPADARLLEVFACTKKPGDEVFSGSTCKQGEIEAVVIATGVHTFFGKAAHLVDSTHQVGHFQKITVMYAIQHRAYREGINNLLVLLIGGIPIAMPTVLSCFSQGIDRDMVVLLAARASRTENQDAIDTAIVGMLADPKDARASIREVHFLPFNPVDKRTALTYIDSGDGRWYRASKGAPEQILSLVHNKPEIEARVHAVIDKFAERGLRSLAVALQEVPEKSKESEGGTWHFYDHGDQLAIAKETGRRLGMGSNISRVDELIENADGFAGVFPEHKYEIVRRLQDKQHICGMTGDGVNDAPALKKADIGIAVADATDAARSASDIVLTEPGLSVIISAVLTSRAIFQRMKNYTIYAISITIRIVLGFLLLALIWKVKPSPLPDSWKLREIFATGIVLGSYLALTTVFGVRHIGWSQSELTAAVYLQVSIISQALIFVTRSRRWCFMERPGLYLMLAFVVAQVLATLLAVYPAWGFANIRGIGWHWGGVIWLYSFITFLPLDVIKFSVCYALSGRAWELLFERRVAFTRKKDFGKEEREAEWAHAQRTLHGLHPAEEPSNLISSDRNQPHERTEMVEQAKRRAEIARLRELHTLKGHVESVVRLKGLDIDSIQQAYTV
ncbi:hypothetical protein KP509_02G114700 [Ceratopteris richardii]|uniref:P-type H(+)-exporting transporter n=1 Tax=Ceratopteris richardii TaxID=49495 RepID=A0A8T2VDU4_CERRI|nr:hypothetical protein KP509_02G114700 [Ceratopteris richardii]